MFIYWVVWFILSFFSILNKNYSYELKFIFYMFLLCLFFLVGFRFEVGADWYNYLEIYDIFLYGYDFNNIFKTDPAYGILNYISSTLGFRDTVFINGICALIGILCIYFFSKGFRNPWPLLMVLFPYFILVVSMGYTRQAVAASLSLIFFMKLFGLEKKSSLLILILSFLFHKTAIFLLIFYPILFVNNKISKYLYSLFVLFSLLIIVYLSIGSNQYLEVGGEMQSTGFYLRMLFYFIPFLLYISFLRSKVTSIHRNFCDLFLFLFVFLFFLGSYFSTLSDRLSIYLTFFNVYIIVKSLELMRRDFNFIFTLILIVFYTVYMYVWFYFGTWSGDWVPYSNYLLIDVL